MPKTLKPCPFCASRDVEVQPFAGRGYVAECQKCHATGPMAGSWVDAEKLWNERRGPSGDGKQ